MQTAWNKLNTLIEKYSQRLDGTLNLSSYEIICSGTEFRLHLEIGVGSTLYDYVEIQPF